MRQTKLGLYRRLEKARLTWTHLGLGRRFPVLRQLYTRVAGGLRPRDIQVDGHTVRLHPEDIGLSHNLLFSGEYETFELALYRACIMPGATVFDIGANIGLYTLDAARQVTPSGRVYAFEPDRENFALLRHNIQANGYANVILMEVAVSARSDTLTLYLNKNNRGDHRTYPTEGEDYRDSYQVRAVALDEALPTTVVPNVIKMDIQGFEPFAVQGMRQVIERSPRLALFSELWPYGLQTAGVQPRDYLDQIRALGLEVWHVDSLRQRLVPIHDDAAVLDTLTGDQYTDLLGLKGDWPALARWQAR